MATAQDIIDDATLRLGRRPAGTAFNTFNANLNSECFKALQKLIARLSDRTLLSIPKPSATTDTLDLYPGQEESLGYLAADSFISVLRVSQVNPKLMQQIQEAEEHLATYSNIDISVDMSGQYPHHSRRYNIETDS